MANQQHLEWLEEGVNAWNKRRALTHFKPQFKIAVLNKADLRGADLRGADLRGADLRGADLRKVDLIDADLRGAKLIGADLREADLIDADLRGAKLIGADLREADLIDADLIEAKLREADLTGADLTGADLTGADLTGTYLREADLREAFVRSEKIQSGSNHADDWIFTDLTKAIGLSQNLLDLMDGDRGTRIPPNLTYPAHWPELEDHIEPDVEPPAELDPPSDEVLQERLAAASSVEGVVVDGKITFADRPVNTPPSERNPNRLQQLLDAQIDLADDISKDAASLNYNVPQEVARRVERYLTKLQAEHRKLNIDEKLSWYTLENAMVIFKSCLDRLDYQNFQDEFRKSCDLLIAGHENLRPLVEPKQIPPDDPEAPPPVPEPSLAKLTPDLSAALRPAVDEARHIPDVELVLDEPAEKFVDETLNAFREALDEYENAYSDEQREKKAGWLRRTIKTVASTFAEIIKVTTAGVLTAVLTSPNAAAILLQRWQALLHFLKLFFEQ